MVRMRVGANDVLDVATRGVVKALNVLGQGWAWIDHDEAAFMGADNVGVGARSCHQAWVGRSQSRYIFKEWGCALTLPIQVMLQLTFWAHQDKFSKGTFVLHVARYLAP